MTWASLVGSLVAVLLVAWLVGKLGLGHAEPLDEDGARRLAESTNIGGRFGEVAFDHEGRGALVEDLDGGAVLIRAHGDKWVARSIRPRAPTDVDGDALILPSDETMFGTTKLVLGAGEAYRWAERLKG